MYELPVRNNVKLHDNISCINAVQLVTKPKKLKALNYITFHRNIFNFILCNYVLHINAIYVYYWINFSYKISFVRQNFYFILNHWFLILNSSTFLGFFFTLTREYKNCSKEHKSIKMWKVFGIRYFIRCKKILYVIMIESFNPIR